jgi:GDP dissociation inhibitor
VLVPARPLQFLQQRLSRHMTHVSAIALTRTCCVAEQQSVTQIQLLLMMLLLLLLLQLQDAFDDRQLVQLLCEEGLPPELQDVVLYGIAQADVQQQQDQQQSECSRFVVTASHGLSLLSLYAASLGRYGGRSAFMLPAYGTGSLPEAFVRLAAVRGAVTALRYEAACVALPQTSHPAAAAATATATSLQATEQSIDSSGTVPDASLCDASVTLCNGQMLAAGAVLASVHAAPPSLLQHCHAWPRVARCAALLDGSVVPGDDALLLVFPPGTLPGVAAPVVVRGLQLAHTHGVTPPGMCLLHLAAVIPDSNREGWLSPNSVSGSVSAAAAEQGQAAHASIAPAAAAACAAVSVAAEAQLAELVLRPALEALALLDDTMTCEKQQQEQ